jgi:predicted lipoprotein with Yx(FWY)xxD motif
MRAIAVIAAALVLAACGSDSESDKAAIGTADKDGRTVLVNADGMTLYALSGEKGGKFTCTDAKCLAAWTPVTDEPSGDVDGLGMAKRPDGKEQVTYKDEPLYTFTGDKQEGDVKGDGVGAWHAVTVDGKPPDSGGGGGGGGGYGGY